MANEHHYSRTISVKSTSKEVYTALTTGIEYWWTKPDKPLSKLGDKVKFTFPPGKSFWTFEVIHLVANSRVEMLCVEALHLHEGQPKAIEQEWLGTTVIFDITTNGEYTDIQLEHIGLTPSLLCYEVCQAGWDFFFMNSLKAYLKKGRGKPHRG